VLGWGREKTDARGTPKPEGNTKKGKTSSRKPPSGKLACGRNTDDGSVEPRKGQNDLACPAGSRQSPKIIIDKRQEAPCKTESRSCALQRSSSRKGARKAQERYHIIGEGNKGGRHYREDSLVHLTGRAISLLQRKKGIASEARLQHGSVVVATKER